MLIGTQTYILITIRGEYYCGKTKNLDKRIEEHKKSINGSWFYFNNRQNFTLLLAFNGDYEKEIKRFGVKKFVDFLRSYFQDISQVSLS